MSEELDGESEGSEKTEFGYDESALEKAFVRSIGAHGHSRIVWSREELATLARNIKNASNEEEHLKAVHALACTALRYMLKVANKYRRRTSHHVSILDVFSWAYLGLVRAAKDYDPERSTFTTYCTAWVHQYIRRGFLDLGRTVRIPVHEAQKSFQFLYTWDTLRVQLGREPHLSELADACDMNIETAERYRLRLAAEISLDAPVRDVDGNNDDTLVGLLESHDAELPDVLLGNRESKALVWSHLARLDEKEREILIARFGLRGEDPVNLQDLGERYSLTRERIRQIESKALEKLRRWMAGEKDAHL